MADGSDFVVGLARSLQYFGMFLTPLIGAKIVESRRRVLPVALLGLEDENENTTGRGVRFSGVRMDALRLLGLMGAASQPAVPSLVQSVRDVQSPYSLPAAAALYRIGKHRDEALARLKQGLSSRNPDERARAIYAVGEAAPEGGEFVSLLEKAAEDVDYLVRRSARRELKRIASGSSR